MDRGACQTIVHRVIQSQTQLKRLSTHTRSFIITIFKQLDFCLFIWLVLAALGLCCFALAFSGFSECSYSFLCCAGFSLRWLLHRGAQALGLWASVVVAHGLTVCVVCGNLPGPGMEHMSSPLVSRFLSTAPPGKLHSFI